MQAAVPLACFLSVIRPPGVQFENSLLQISPVDKSKCPYVKDGNDVAFQLFTRHNPTVFQDLKVGDDEKLFASNIDFHDKTVLYFHAWMETPEDGSGVMVREAYMQRGDTNVIMVDARSLQAGPWYFTAAQNTWYIGRFAGQFIDYLVARGLNLNNTHLVGHSLGAHVAGVAGSALKSGKVARITGLDAALPLFDNLPLQQRLDPTDANFVDTIHTDAGIFGYKTPIGHVDFYPNKGISPQPGCELEVVIPQHLLLNKCDARTQTNGFYTYYLKGKRESTYKSNSLERKLEKLFTFIQAVRAKSSKNNSVVTLDKVKTNINNLYDFKDSIVDYLNDYVDENDDKPTKSAIRTEKVERYDYLKERGEDKDDKNIKNNKSSDGSVKVATEDNVEQLNKTLVGNKEDQVAEESDFNTKADIDTFNIDEKTEIFAKETLVDTDVRRKRDTDLSNHKSDDSSELTVESDDSSELTVESGNLSLKVDRMANTDQDFMIAKYTTVKTNIKPLENDTVTSKFKLDVTPTSGNLDDEFKISLDDVDTTINAQDVRKKESKPIKFNLFRRRPLLRQIIRIIPRINKNKKSNEHNNNKRTKFAPLKKVKDQIDKTSAKIGFKFRPVNVKKNILRRQKRFLPFFQRAEDSDNILFRMLDFLIKNRKNVLPVFTVMREINTLVKSGNGELNHFSKESNNYIGATPPAFIPITYNLELGNENRVMAFVKKLFGVIPKGDRLTISGK